MSKIAFIGTSHTYGDCSDVESGYMPKQMLWSSILGRMLGKKVLNFGDSGATNFELQVIINDAFSEGYLDDVDTIIFEPRISHNGACISPPKEESLDDSFDTSLIKITREFEDESHRFFHQLIYHSATYNDVEDIDHAHMRYFNDQEPLTPAQAAMLKQLRHYISLHYVLLKEETMVYKGLELVRNLQNLCKLSNKKLYWVNWECEETTSLRMNPRFDPVLEDCLNPDLSIRNHINRTHGKHLQCECHHFGIEAQNYIAQFLLERINGKSTNH